MTGLADRKHAVMRAMERAGIETLLLASNGLHLIDLPDPVAHLTGFRSLAEALAVLRADGRLTLVVTPAADAERAAETVRDAAIVGADDLAAMPGRLAAGGSIRWVGLGAMPVRMATALAETAGTAAGWDADFDAATGPKTDDELARARLATGIAERGFADLLQLAGEGVRSPGGLKECDLAVELNLRMKAMGASDSFLMLNASPRSLAIMPSSERRLQPGDMILVELSPAVAGQFVQICRTAILGEPPPALEANYALLTRALRDGIEAVRPGAPVSAICDAIDRRMAEAGYAAYSRPPHLRRRGHGLGCGSIWPGDVAYDNPVIMASDMLFVVHPNQLLPEAGYMMCGEPVRVTAGGAEMLSATMSALAVIDL